MSEDSTVGTVDATEEPEGEQEETQEKPPQSVTVADAGPARKSLTIELPTERIKKAIEESYGKLKDDAAIPGFRRGRAPQRLIEKRFGSAVRDDVKGQLIAESYEQAVEDEGLKVLGQPDVKDIEKIELPEDGPLTYTVEIEVAPEFDLPSLEAVAVNRPIAEVRGSDIDEELDSIRQRYGKMNEVEAGKADAGDYLEVEAFILAGENTALPDDPAPAAEDDQNNPVIAHYPNTYVLVHGQDKEFKGHVVGILVDDLGKRLTGKTVGDTEAISMTGPGGHESERIKDKPITIHLKINSIQRLEPATVESLLEQSDLESEEALRQELRQTLEANRDRNQQVNMHEQVCEYLLEHVNLDLPEGLSSRQTSRLLQRMAMELAYRGLSQDDIEQKLAESRASREEEARKQLKLFFILEKAAEALAIEVDDQEVNGRIAMMAMQQGRRPEKLRQEMLRTGRVEQLYISIRDQKTLDAIIEKATITDVELPDDDDEQPKKTSKKKTSKKKAAPKKEKAAEE